MVINVKSNSLTCVKKEKAVCSGGIYDTATPLLTLWAGLHTLPHPMLLEGSVSLCSSTPAQVHKFSVPYLPSIADSWHSASGFGSCFYCLHLGQIFPNSFWPVIVQFLSSWLCFPQLWTLLLTGFISDLILKFCYIDVHQTGIGRLGGRIQKYSKITQNTAFSFKSSPC